MKYSVLICTRREPGLLSAVVGDLSSRGLFPHIFWSELMGVGTVRIRLELECTENVLLALHANWENVRRLQSVVSMPLMVGSEPPPPSAMEEAVRPAPAMD